MSNNQLRNSFEFETRMIPKVELPYVPPTGTIYLRTSIVSYTRPDILSLEEFEAVAPISLAPVTIDFSVKNGDAFHCFAFEVLPEFPEYNFWRRSDFNNGRIGGDWNSPYQNLWPTPTIMQYRGRNFRVYIASYSTTINSNVELWVK
jgi:hypothetical protein